MLSASTLGTLIVEAKHRAQSTPETLVNRLRARSWWIIIVTCLIVFYSGTVALMLMATGLATWASYEVLQAEKFKSVRLVLACVAASTFCLQWIILNGEYSLVGPSIVALMLAAASAQQVRSPKTRSVLLLTFIVVALSCLIGIFEIANLLSLSSTDVFVLLFFAVGSNDVFQYTAGKLFGRTQLAKKISPNKTREGAIGGVLMCSLMAVCLSFYFSQIPMGMMALLGASISLTGILGDLLFSVFKRKWGIKNSGRGIPGHGGIIDRIDSLTLAAPCFVLLASLFLGA